MSNFTFSRITRSLSNRIRYTHSQCLPHAGAPPQTLLRPRLDLLGEGRPHLGFGKAWRTSLECCRVTAGQRGGHLRNSTSRRGILARNCSESRGKRSDRPKCSHIRESMKPDPHSGDSRHAGFPFPSGTPAADTLRHVEFGASQCCATRNRIRTSRDQHLTIGETHGAIEHSRRVHPTGKRIRVGTDLV